LPRRPPRGLPYGAGDRRGQRRPERGAPGLPRHGGSLPLTSQSARKRCAASPGEAALLTRAPRPGIRQRGQATGGVVQSRAWMVSGVCHRCGCAVRCTTLTPGDWTRDQHLWYTFLRGHARGARGL